MRQTVHVQEVGGASTYEDKRKASLAQMAEHGANISLVDGEARHFFCSWCRSSAPGFQPFLVA